MQEIKDAIIKSINEIYPGIEVELTRPDKEFGDFSSNAALIIAHRLSKNPNDVALEIKNKIETNWAELIDKVEIAGPGFINIYIKDACLISEIKRICDTKDFAKIKTYKDQIIVAEYSDPNPFKVLHAGHLYTFIVGDSIANLLESAGAKVHAVNFGGDVGLHVAKAMWGILQKLDGENPEKLNEVLPENRADWIAGAYVEGSKAYKESEDCRKAIVELNKKVYAIFDEDDKTSSFAQIYWTCRSWSYDYFDDFYVRMKSRFAAQKQKGERVYYPESENVPLGLKTVKEQLAKGVYQESDGAVVFRGEPYGLHTRVFINSEGLPTYETKDVGLSVAKWRDYHFDKSIIITANDIVEYMKVVLKSIEQFEPKLALNTIHLTHGMIKMRDGVKMSSRKGNILKATDILDAAEEACHTIAEQKNDSVMLGAVKYAFLKQRIGPDVIYDSAESVSLHGNSGPYIQYAHARACSILDKVQDFPPINESNLTTYEKNLAVKIAEYPEIIEKSAKDLMPHQVCTYLFELAQVFNRFYENEKVIGSDKEPLKIRLVKAYAKVLQHGLWLLGIEAPQKM
jgi:arginyl-tRNA synthetase